MFKARSQRSEAACLIRLSAYQWQKWELNEAFPASAQHCHEAAELRRSSYGLYLKGSSQDTTTHCPDSTTTSVQRVMLSGKPCNIKAFRMLYIGILTVKPNSCGQERKRNTASTPNQDVDVYKT